MKPPNSILVGIDFSACSCVALGHARRIASWTDASLHLVHVVESNVEELCDTARLESLREEIRDRLIQEAGSRWESFSEACPDAGGLALEVRVDSRLAGIRHELEAHAADLLVLGAYGDTRPNVGMGTLASACIRGVGTDVLIVRDNYREPFHTVVVGIDFSPSSRAALEAAAFVARHEGAKLHAVYVVPDRRESYSRLQRELEPRLAEFVSQATGQDAALDLRCHVYPYSGYRSGILEFAALVNADLVVVGTKGQSNLRDVFLGSTAEKVLRDSVIAVWAARAVPHGS